MPDIDWNNESNVGYRYLHCVNTRVLNMMHDCGFDHNIQKNLEDKNNLVITMPLDFHWKHYKELKAKGV